MKGSCPCRLKESESLNPSLQLLIHQVQLGGRAASDMKEEKQIRETGRIMSQRLQYNTLIKNLILSIDGAKTLS